MTLGIHPVPDFMTHPARDCTLRRFAIAASIFFALTTCASAQAPTTAATTTPASRPAEATTQPAPAPELPLELRFTTVPTAPAEISKAIEQIKAELAALAPTTQPATSQPTTQPDGTPEAQLDGWRMELWSRLQEFHNQLNELGTQVEAVSLLSRDDEVERLTQTLEDFKQQLTELKNRPLPEEITEEDVATAKAEYEEKNQAIDALNATLTQQEALLREGFAAQRARIGEDLKAASARREKLDATYEVDIEAADTDQFRYIIELRRRTVAARVALLETSRAVVEQKEKRTQQELEQNKLKRDAMRPLVMELRERMNSLIEEKSRSSAERLRARIEDPTLSPLRKKYYQLQLLKEETITKLQKEYSNNIAERYQQSALQIRESLVIRDAQFWVDFRESLSRRTSSEVLTAYREAGKELSEAKSELARLQSLLDRSFTEDRKIELLGTQARDEYEKFEKEFRELAADATDAETIKLTQNVGQFKLDLRKAFNDILKMERDVIDRLRAAVELTQDNVALWEEAESTLYWAHLITRGPTIIDPEGLKSASGEVKALSEGLLAGKAKEIHRSILLRLDVITVVDWLLLVFAAIFALYVGYASILRCGRVVRQGMGESTEPEEGEGAAPELTFGRRLRFHGARVGIALVPALLFSILQIVFAVAIGLVGEPYSVTKALSLIIGGAAVGFGLFNASFKAAKPRYRLIPCSAAVARYYRRNGYALVILALILMGPAILLQAADLAEFTAELLRAWFVFVATALALIFLVRRETVLNVFPRTERGRLAGTVTFVRAAHPFLIVLALSLLVMHLIGFKAMAIYITIGLSSTLALVLLAALLYHLTKELSLWVVARLRKMHRAYPSEDDKPDESSKATTAAPGSVSPDETKDPEKEKEARQPTVARACVAVIRWLLFAGVLITSLSVWGIRPYELKQILDYELWTVGEQSVTLWRIGGAILAVFLTIVVSRTVRQTLDSKFYPHHTAIDRGAQAAINTLLHYVILIIGVYIALQTMRLDFGALAVLFGGLGLGIGLGLQPLIVNFISGLLMLFERHVKVGDIVMVHDKLGEVTKVSMRSTTIRTPDGVFLIIPNGEFINQKVENWTLENKPIRGIVEVGVAYAADARKVKELLLEIAFAEPKVLMDPTPDVFFTQFGDNSLNFSLACWFPNPPERWQGMLSLRYTITERFREQGIEIPFPQRTLSLINDKPLQISIHGSGMNGMNGSEPVVTEPKGATAKN